MHKSMMEQAQLPLIIADDNGHIVFANKWSEDFTGHDREGFLKGDLRDICAPYERSRYIFSCLSDIKRTTEVDIDIKRKNIGFCTANVIFTPFCHHETAYLLVILRDVTRRRIDEGKTRKEEDRYRKLLAERNMLQDQLNRSSKVAFMGELAAGIAHEINNPLGIILGFVQDILEEISSDNPLFESIKIIEQETARCVGVVKNLLDFARLKPPERTPVDIVDLLEGSITLLMPRIKKNRIKIKNVFDKGLPCIKVDPQLIQQVFLNVLINAIQAMPDGGDLAAVIGLVRGRPPEESHDWIRISISDTGKGISEKDLHRVFDPFFTTKGSKGTGLGLSVCQRIMEDHCGKIEVENSTGSGTICSLYFSIMD